MAPARSADSRGRARAGEGAAVPSAPDPTRHGQKPGFLKERGSQGLVPRNPEGRGKALPWRACNSVTEPSLTAARASGFSVLSVTF